MKRVIITAMGGLGNQMFCYAFYKKMCIEYPEIQFVMDISDVWDGHFERGAEFLTAFPEVMVEKADSAEIFKVEGKITFQYRGKGSRLIRIVVDALNKRLMKPKERFCITEGIYGNQRKYSKDDWDKIHYFRGFWQKTEYYQPYFKELQRDFQFAPITDVQNKKLAEEMRNRESVSVHVRRGDYVGEVLDILDTEYYRKIIEQIKNDNPDSCFYFFSNDSEYVEREYKWLDNKVIVKNNNSRMNSFRDMQLMSVCKKNIIANSTFSIWAALLNSNPDKEVYYPSHYYRGIEMETINMPGFIKVEVENQKG